jgi:hypothetical protein
MTPFKLIVRIMIAVWFVFSLALVYSQFTTVTTLEVNHKDLPGLINRTEIGWCPIVGDKIVNREPESGTHYVVVCLNNKTNELRVCHINMMPGDPISMNDMVWYDDSTTPPTPKVYVVAYYCSLRENDMYYVKWNAALPALHLIPKKDKK